MSMSGSGVGGSIGGPPQLSSKEMEASAWALVNKERMGVVKDTLEVPFTQVGGNVWKYSTDSSRPTLMPLGTDRTTSEESQAKDESWKSHLDDLMNKLPPQIKARLQREQGKPFEFRSREFMLFDHTLTTLAKGLSWMENAEKTIDPQTPEGERTLQNQSLAGKALKGVVNQSRAQVEGAESFLKEVGPNDPNFDKLYYFTQAGGSAQKRMNEFLEILKDPSHPLPTQAQKDGLCQDIGKLAKEFNAVSHGNNLQLLGTMFETMEAVAQALSMTPSSPTLFLGLKTALKGIFKSESEAGLIGDDLAMLLNAIQSGMAATLMKKLGPAKLKMMMMMLMTALGGFGALAELVSKHGLGRFPADDEEEEEEGKKFNLVLILKLLISSDFLRIILGVMGTTCGLKESEQEKTADLLEPSLLMMMILTGGNNKTRKTESLTEELLPELTSQLKTLQNLIESTLFTEEESSKQLAVCLRQTLLSLENDEIETFLQIMNVNMEQMNGSMEGLKKDLKEVKSMSDLFKHSFGEGLQSETKIQTKMICAA